MHAYVIDNTQDTVFKWVPESPSRAVYAVDPAKQLLGNATYNVDEALQFDTEEACKAWCEANPTPTFVPREHGWG